MTKTDRNPTRFAQNLVKGAAICMVLSACATSPGHYSNTPDSLDEDAFAELLGTLEPQSLNPGQCGLFLWSRAEQPALVLFSAGQKAEAKMMIANREVTLSRRSAEGEAIFGQYPTQSFHQGDISVDVSVAIERRPNMSGGAVVPRGSLRFAQTGGWNLVVPVGGLIACQPA